MIHPYTKDENLQGKVKEIVDQLFEAGFRVSEHDVYEAMLAPSGRADLTTLDILQKLPALKVKRRAHKINLDL